MTKEPEQNILDTSIDTETNKNNINKNNTQDIINTDLIFDIGKEGEQNGK